jgi:hypothetical protein
VAPRHARVDLLPGVRAIAYRASARHGWLPIRDGRGWWEPSINLLGCVLFGISAIAGHVVPGTGTLLEQAAANWNTSLAPACFAACAVFTLLTGYTSKLGHLRRLSRLEQAVERDAEKLITRR